MKPWMKGYIEYKEDEIARLLREGSFAANKLPARYGFRLDERIIEYPWLFSRLPTGEGRLLDAGSVLNFEFVLEQPALRKKKIDICTLAPEPRCFWRKGISYVYEDLRQLPYCDGLFDWIVCLSTIEHVGMDNALYTGAAAKDERDATIALVLASGDQGMHRGLKAKRRGVRRDVMHPPVGDQESAGDAIDRNV